MGRSDDAAGGRCDAGYGLLRGIEWPLTSPQCLARHSSLQKNIMSSRGTKPLGSMTLCEGGHAHAHKKLFLADGALPGFDFLGHARLHGMNIHELLPPLVLSP